VVVVDEVVVDEVVVDEVVVDEVVVDEVVVDEVVVDSSALATPAPTLSRASITTKPSRMYFALNATDLRYSR